jgi:hypothetical protein
MVSTAKGSFEIRMSAETLSETAHETGIGRMSLSKTYAGDLAGRSEGEMLGFRNLASGAGGYVAMETVRGTLDGKQGSFVLQHSSTMEGSTATQSIQVVPGSGTGELAGLSGQLVIHREDGRHEYAFDYSLPAGSGN